MIKALIILSVVAIASATGALGGYGGNGLYLANAGYGGQGGYGGGYGGGYLADAYDKPIPYSFGYNVKDDYGTVLTRDETGDGSGAVKGSYSYVDGYGISRIVEYVADKGGFRATVKTNEPGTETSNPADVIYDAKPILVQGPKLAAAPRLIAPLGYKNGY